MTASEAATNKAMLVVSDTPHLSYARTGLYSTLQASPNLAWFRAVRQVPRLRSELRIAVVVMRAGVVGLPGGGFGYVVDAHIALAMPGYRLHLVSFLCLLHFVLHFVKPFDICTPTPLRHVSVSTVSLHLGLFVS